MHFQRRRISKFATYKGLCYEGRFSKVKKPYTGHTSLMGYNGRIEIKVSIFKIIIS
jgi:hypothetical protein